MFFTTLMVPNSPVLALELPLPEGEAATTDEIFGDTSPSNSYFTRVLYFEMEEAYTELLDNRHKMLAITNNAGSLKYPMLSRIWNELEFFFYENNE
ncbi:hypothetical protein Mapa_002707 [Marchantia paleacea]|nr:hypothetical protein Mapa_002707 [Marchantia paleacea]